MQGSVSGSPLSPVPQSLSDRPASPSAQAPLQDPVNQPATKRTKFSYVLVPQLSQGTKENYKATEEVGLKMEMEIKLDEVIGEYREGNTDYYFARYEDGIAHKYPAQIFATKHPELVEAYEMAKAEGTLKHFDPSAHYVHPRSRVKFKINISQGRDRARVSMSSARSIRSDNSVQYVPDSEEEEMNVNGTDNDSYSIPSIEPRRTTRQTAQKQGTLPFSPKKTRSRVIRALDSGSEAGSLPSRSHATRKSTRQKASVKINYDSEFDPDEDEDDDEDGDSDFNSIKRSSKGKGPTRPKVPTPSYGHVRDVDALKYDPYPEDEENSVFREHRSACEKCHDKPAHILLRNLAKRSKGKGKKRKRSEENEFELSDEEKFSNMGGWVRCLKCPVAVHWSCLAVTQQTEIIKAARSNDRSSHLAGGGSEETIIVRRSFLETEETTEFICASCTKGGTCMGCMETIQTTTPMSEPKADANGDVEMTDCTTLASDTPASKGLELERSLLFRCFTCKRISHYEHLPCPRSLDRSSSASEIADYCQGKGWSCADCQSFRYPLDKILAWRPYPPNAVQPVNANYRDQLPREYLVKWSERSYRRTTWVPHMWLLSTNASKLKNFLTGGTKVNLLAEIPEEVQDVGEMGTSSKTFEIGAESRETSNGPGKITTYGPLDALPDAEKRVPPPWKTVDRVLDVILWDREATAIAPKKGGRKGKNKRRVVIESDDEDMAVDQAIPEELVSVFETGELPESLPQMKASEWERAHGSKLTEDDIDKVVWAFIKWDELGYEEASWDAPPRRGEPGYDAFVIAFKAFLFAQTVFVPKLKQSEQDKFDKRPTGGYGQFILKDPAGLKLGQDQSLKLMPFQVDGFNWLCDNWWNRQPCILADDMGLGKTVQMATFIGNIATKWKAFPALVVVPNSTITNWVREFERWAPNLRVVPFYGERKARDIIREFELFHHKVPDKFTNAKFHVLITTYEGITGTKDWGTVFKRQPRWEVLVVDEGQRLKSDSSLLFKKLNELNSAHRVIMTGTPLNNNMRELFNLMNFLDSVEWKDLELLDRQYQELDEELVKQLHTRLRPYFLRRLKSEVLNLPPKNEVIVPVSMAPLQKKVYRSILSHNLDLLKGLTQPKSNGQAKGKLNNILMHLRKCLQHPYLYSEDIEPKGIPPQEMHDKLIDASAKLRFLKVLLPKLKARGHRVLLFSQFVIALDVIEDFLGGEGFKYLRLDGNTKGSDRQKSMDEYNKPNSDYFIFLLTTRAGGVGINLFTADTVIIFDPDFNPHQDFQAIARAYRYGQKNTCLVFKLMVKDSAEERIMQIGKKKLVLDHLIVQKMDEDDDSPGENVQSILTYGAQALFDENEAAKAKDINYTDQDIENLIEKTETEGDTTEGPKEGGLAFNFAKVWETGKNEYTEVGDVDEASAVNAWAHTLDKIDEERKKDPAQEIALSGRGARRKAADVAKTKLTGQDSFTETARRRTSSVTDLDFQDHDSIESDTASNVSARSDDEDFAMVIPVDKGVKKKRRSRITAVPVQLEDIESPKEPALDCGLCGGKHGIKQCLMTDRSENLAEYRMMLIMHAEDEPWEDRYAAVMAIDELLHSRGHTKLVQGQPLRPLPKATYVPPTKKPKQAAEAAKEYVQKQRAGLVPRPTIKDYQGGPEVEVVRNFRGKSSTGQPAQTNAEAGPSRPRAAITPASTSTNGRAASIHTAQPVASGSTVKAKVQQFEKIATTASPAPGANGSQDSEDKCRLCNRSPHHKVKECPLVKNKTAQEIEQLIKGLDKGDAKKMDLVLLLRKIQDRRQKRVDGKS